MGDVREFKKREEKSEGKGYELRDKVLPMIEESLTEVRNNPEADIKEVAERTFAMFMLELMFDVMRSQLDK